jgi:hypothetical protein
MSSAPDTVVTTTMKQRLKTAHRETEARIVIPKPVTLKKKSADNAMHA